MYYILKVNHAYNIHVLELYIAMNSKHFSKYDIFS